jgi:hypothetical protein
MHASMFTFFNVTCMPGKIKHVYIHEGGDLTKNKKFEVVFKTDLGQKSEDQGSPFEENQEVKLS